MNFAEIVRLLIEKMRKGKVGLDEKSEDTAEVTKSEMDHPIFEEQKKNAMQFARKHLLYLLAVLVFGGSALFLILILARVL